MSLEEHDLVYPTSIPIRDANQGCFVFARTVAIFVLEMLQDDMPEDLRLTYSTMNNAELGECLLAEGAVPYHLYGGVVNDDVTNGFINAFQTPQVSYECREASSRVPE
jgi:hypothetical protein